MKKIFQYAVFLTFIGVSSAEAQVVTRGERPVLDSVSQSYHDAIILVRDTMLTVRGAASRASRDLRGTAYEVVVNRIGRLRRACDAASVLASEQVVVFDRRAAEPRLADLVGSMAGSLQELSLGISRECSSVFTVELVQAQDSLTAWGPYHISRLQRLEQTYLGSAYALAKAANFRIDPPLAR
jgi:hypothetical protein